MKFELLLVLVLSSGSMSFARSGEAVDVEVAQAPAAGKSSVLPRCVDGKEEVQRIKNGMSSQPLNYQPYREAFQKESDAELLARLAYAETKGANCPKLEAEISKLIVSSIYNRARIRANNLKSVIYQPMQYNSSMAVYAESKYQEFLCPKDAELWAATLASSKAALSGNPPANLNPKSVNYFLYQHSPRWKKEPWTLKEDVSDTNPELQKCVRFFLNPSWK